MRATYEDLLRVARRTAIEAARSGYDNRSQAVEDWAAVMAASEHHFRWLRHRFEAAELYSGAAARTDRPLGRLAQVIGAGSDLLASQDAANARLLDNRRSLQAARAELAAVVLTAADCIMSCTRSKTPERRRLEAARTELERLADAAIPRGGLGALGDLATGQPISADDPLSVIPRYAARWERAEDGLALETLLTRDLRSTTAQVRSVCGYVWHLSDGVLTSRHAELDARHGHQLNLLKQTLRAAEAGALRVAESWRRRLSDLYGATGTPSEAAFMALKATLDQIVRRGDSLLEADELVPDKATALRVLETVDEMVWSTEQVARRQQRAVAALVSQGRLFVPRQEAGKLDVRYLRRPATSRPLQSRWLRTTEPAFFTELTACVAWTADHLTAASDIARRLAGTSQERRPERGGPPRSPAPYLEITNSAQPGQEPSTLDR
ncbi:hypothetical protein HPO96_35055 [Kribbella sandramycini]|uniref:Uncharacterized protein n=1 Tax=Kribbella sandramycini TaxID=60450 RepID=A0A7Y4L6T9_9ACTN|nr:hypothetical protein [Kribbella sandramycini]MBB6566692.1 hypothetical protein [Kribbella sandramycini]NOL45480.1 hypothetical protein [Kribbella sandramycini]